MTNFVASRKWSTIFPELCETVEFPVWEEEGQKCSLFTDTREWFRAYCRPEDFILWRQGKAEKYALHEAACIFENHWRVWLAVQGCYLVPTVTNGGVTDNYVVYDINDAVIACVESYYAAQTILAWKGKGYEHPHNEAIV